MKKSKAIGNLDSQHSMSDDDTAVAAVHSELQIFEKERNMLLELGKDITKPQHQDQ